MAAKKAPKKVKVVKKTAAKSKVEKKVKVSKVFKPNYSDILNVVEKRSKLSASMSDRFDYAVSSGLLVQDLVLGGGLVPGGMYTWAGMEQSAKSTNVMNFIAELVKSPNRPGTILYFDAEGSFDPQYFNSMLPKKFRTPELFGIKDKKGHYTVEPIIRYYPENRGELVLDGINSILARFPDKELLDKQWYYVYENTVPNRKLVGDKYSKDLFSKSNKFYVPTDDTAPQAVIAVDSWISLIPERMDDEDKSAGLAANARLFSDHLPKIKGKLRRKSVILAGVNQLREKPMTQGDPRYEPGGQALRFQSDVRIWNTGRAIPHGTGQLEEEKSVEMEGMDTYRYVFIQNKKNKLATPHLGGWCRLWLKDPKGRAHGFDKVWDAFQYMKMTGQATGGVGKRGLVVGLKDKDGKVIWKAKMQWSEFKSLILLRSDDKKYIKIAKTTKFKDKSLYRVLQRQVTSGLGRTLYYDNLVNLGDDDDE